MSDYDASSKLKMVQTDFNRYAHGKMPFERQVQYFCILCNKFMRNALYSHNLQIDLRFPTTVGLLPKYLNRHRSSPTQSPSGGWCHYIPSRIIPSTFVGTVNPGKSLTILITHHPDLATSQGNQIVTDSHFIHRRL